jgi:hypothetical protein
MIMNKQKTKKPKVFSQIIREENNGAWDFTLMQIELKYSNALMTKVCCLVWWDCQTTKEDYDWSDVYKHIRAYKYNVEEDYEESDLVKVLHELGYPLKKAILRAKQPKNINGKRRL